MRTGQWRRSLTVLLAAAVLASCTSADPQPNPTATQPTSSPTTETPTPTNSPSDPYAVPDEITADYVDLVVNKLYERHGELLRELLSQDPDPSAVMPVEMRENFAAIFDGEQLQRRLDEGDALLQGNRDNALALEDVTQYRHETNRIVAASPTCIVAVGTFDTSGTSVEPIELLQAVALEQLSEPSPENPTGWILADVAANRNSQGEENPDEVMLEASFADLTASALTTTCEEGDVR